MKPSLQLVSNRGGDVGRGIFRVGLPKDLDMGRCRGHASLAEYERLHAAYSQRPQHHFNLLQAELLVVVDGGEQTKTHLPV